MDRLYDPEIKYDCTYQDVCTCLATDPNVGILYREWKSLAKVLHISGHVTSIERRRKREEMTSHEVMLYVLDFWCKSARKEATILNLTLALEEIKQDDLAEHLKNSFDPSKYSTTLEDSLEDSRDNKRIGDISYNTSSSNKLGGNDITHTYVYKGEYNNINVAVKVVPANPDYNKYEKQIQEVEILEINNDHKNVVKFLKLETDWSHIYIATELCNETLEDWLKRLKEQNSMDENLDIILDVLKQTLDGLAYTHLPKNGAVVVHRDLKPQNILLVHSHNQVCAKIADFGISRLLPENETSQQVNTGSGTLGWKAPEIANATTETEACCRQSTKTDIFSLGCIFYYALAGRKHPFGDNSTDRDFYIRHNKKQIDPKHFSSLVEGNIELLERMIAHDPKDRPTIKQILRHPIFWSKRKTLDFLTCVAEVFDTYSTDAVKSCIHDIESKKESKDICLSPDGWMARICSDVKNELQQPKSGRSYDRCKVQDLVIAIRDIIEKYSLLPKGASCALGSFEGTFLSYWVSRFPYVLQTVWRSWQQLRCAVELDISSEYYEDGEET